MNLERATLGPPAIPALTRRLLPALVALAIGTMEPPVQASTAPPSTPAPLTPLDPATPWQPTADAIALEQSHENMTVPEELLTGSAQWTLEDIVDIALRNNPVTRGTWAAARAAAARMRSERGAYYPQIDVDGNYSRTKSSLSSTLAFALTSYTGSASLTYTLFDFGKRSADVEEARRELYAADWTHNEAIQDVVLGVEQTYYQYLYAKAARDAAKAAVDEAQANLDAAERRHDAGLATIADVLQARSLRSQSQLALQLVEGQIDTIRGSLATAMGLPATTTYDVGFLPTELSVSEASETVEELIHQAELHRPDLAAAQAAVLAARAHVKSTRAEGRPALSVQGDYGRRYYDNSRNYADYYTAGVFVHFPLFTGYSQSADVQAAESDAQVAEQRLQSLGDTIELQVWTSYYAVQTASQRLTTSKEFLESATASHDVALDRYRSGVGTILELLAAQTTLEEARAQSIQARTDWLVALAQLAHDSGRLWTAADSSSQRPNLDLHEDGKK